MNELVLSNAQVVLADRVVRAAVAVRDGLIAAVDEGAGTAAGAIDLDGDLLLPGFVELHTDNLEKHFVPRPGVVWPSAAALAAHDAQIVAAGITTVFDSVAVGEYNSASLRRRLLSESAAAIEAGRKARTLRADHKLHMRLEVTDPSVVEMFEPYADDPNVGLASLMDHTPGQRQWWNRDKHKQFVQGRNGWSEAEVEAYFARRVAQQQQWAGPNRIALLEICRRRGLVLASHDDTTPEHIAEAVEAGIEISEFPTSRVAAEAAHAAGMAVVMGAPNVVRGGSHSGNVGALELAEAGLLDGLASDYVPASLLHGALILHEQAGIGLPEAIGAISRKPARMARLDDRGEIRSGLRADLVHARVVDGVPVIRSVWVAGVRVF